MLIEISNCQTLHVVQISCGSRHTAILTGPKQIELVIYMRIMISFIIDSRQVLTAGWNGYGQLGRNGSPFEFLPACTTSYIANILCSGWQTICTLTAY